MTKLEVIKKNISENEKVKKVKKFCHDHGEAIACCVGAAIGGLIIGCMWQDDVERVYDDAYHLGYSDGYTKGGDGLLDDMWMNAAWNGGHSDTVYSNKNGYRLGVHCETLPNKR